MKINLTSEEASILVGIITVWLQRVPHFSKEYDTISGILNKIFDEDKKQVDKVLSKIVVK